MNTLSDTMTPEFAARELLHSLHIHCIPTPMEEVCARLGVTVERTDEIDAEALLIADGTGEVIILINQSIRSVGRVNFTLAHEIGHLRLPHHGRRYSCSYADINIFSSEKPLEREANLFASELLFPEAAFLADIHGMDLSCKAISRLANRYQASVTATALRMCQKTMDSCALAFVQGGKIKWSYASQHFQGEVARGSISQRSVLSSNMDVCDLAEGVAPGDAWLTSRQVIQELQEAIFPLPSLDAWLVLLSPVEGEYEDWLEGAGVE